MLDFYDHALALILVLTLPPRAWFAFRMLVRSDPERRPRVRRRIYIVAALTQWTLVAFVLIRWMLNGRSWAELGLVPILTHGAIGVAVGVVLVVTVIALQLRGGAADHGVLERARGRLSHVEALLPHSPGELRLFRIVAVTAGVCEELMFRGFLIWYFMHFMPLIQAAVVSSISFGIGHAYQGLRYILVTGLLGAFLSAVYLITGSLFLAMLIHALMDLYSGWVGYRLFGVGATGATPAADAAGAGGDEWHRDPAE